MVATVYAMTGDLAEAEDAVHEAYVRCLAALARLVRDGDPLPWVRTVAMRLAISTCRRTRGRLRAHFRHGPRRTCPNSPRTGWRWWWPCANSARTSVRR
ncbi:sigma factor [Streptomyces umbrinus]|uniref:sigma factor n=1 Tax=Streptomyces umbrinus TaxID=67370 RepID=UPI0033DAEB05